MLHRRGGYIKFGMEAKRVEIGQQTCRRQKEMMNQTLAQRSTRTPRCAKD